MTEVWTLPGYDVQALLGYGSTGEVWRAVELASGESVALKRLRVGADPTAVSALQREAHVLQGLDTPYVVRLRALLGDGAVQVLDLAAGGSLAALLARRGSLDPGEVVTIAGPLAQALAVAHEQGLVHGDITANSILFTGDGMPLLADLGLAGLRGDQPDPAADIGALADVCRHLLAATPSAPHALLAAIERALLPDPTQRPDAVAFAAAIRGSHPAAPVRLAASRTPVRPAQPRPPAPEPAWRSPRAWALSGAAGLLLLAAGVGWVWGHVAPPDVPPLATSAQAAPPDWPEVLDRIDAARAAALRDADETPLLQVYAPGSTGLARDVATVRRLREAGQQATGVRHTVRAVQQLSYDGRSARLRVTDELSAYVVTGGGERTQVPARGPADFRVDVVRTPQGWRLLLVELLS